MSEVITNQSLVPLLNGAEVLYSWPSLYSPTAKEEAELTKLRAETAVTLIGAGVVTEEVRQMAAEMLAIDLETQAEVEVMEPPEVDDEDINGDDEEEVKGDVLAQIRFRFQDQARRIADGKT